jgi:hypothetical protein
MIYLWTDESLGLCLLLHTIFLLLLQEKTLAEIEKLGYQEALSNVNPILLFNKLL